MESSKCKKRVVRNSATFFQLSLPIRDERFCIDFSALDFLGLNFQPPRSEGGVFLFFLVQKFVYVTGVGIRLPRELIVVLQDVANLVH